MASPSMSSHHLSPRISDIEMEPSPLPDQGPQPRRSSYPQLEQHHPTQVPPSYKRKPSRPWTNTEQEALYVAVERFKLFGRWREIKIRMNLDRTPNEIGEEYMRLYGEILDSDDEDLDDMMASMGSSTSSSPHTFPASTSGKRGRPLGSGGMRKTASPVQSRQQTSPRMQIRRSQSMEWTRSSEYQHGDMDSHYPRGGPMSPASSSPSTRPTDDTPSNPASDHSAEVKPTRTVRVWTQRQSEQLKSLIEDYFPGGYRINWVWVASQMGNTFTRKQCKNKWEIMRRRAGTEEEVALLKKGHEEFGPSWSQIQEKYLPERSQGSIAIMWELLLAREAGQQQKH
ncbi:hypothetical protein BG006_005696 [Podila minutissima]|uniref:Myb-like domain-containing protein n=1 Tax=Podila minutissima TaxID=64525 RepID=A0A9P5VLV7_9FUNG|nr:hypothetical protein BG006_005696 [Podila minutissima]